MNTRSGGARRWGHLLRNLTRLATVRWSVGALASALMLAGCFGTKTPAGHAAESARSIASRQGLTVESVDCSRHGAASWTCTGRLQSGHAYTCRVRPTGRVSATGTCTVQARRR